jgi:hypothetical protein
MTRSRDLAMGVLAVVTTIAMALGGIGIFQIHSVFFDFFFFSLVTSYSFQLPRFCVL